MAATRLSIRPSALGGKGLLLFLALELAFLATSYSNLFFLLLAFSAVLGGLGGFWAWRNLRGLQLGGIEVASAPAGTARPITCWLDGGARARFDLALELPLPDGHQEVGHCSLAIGVTAVTGSVPARRRSVVELRHVHVQSRYPFGFFRARLSLPVATELITYPEPMATDEQRRAGRHAGDHAQTAKGRGSTLAGLRPFRTGDALGDVHWKATARRGTAVVKEREREAAPAVEVVLDRRCGGEQLENALGQLCALVLAARHGAPLHVFSQDAELVVDPERGGVNDALRWLAGTDTLPQTAPAPPVHQGAMRLPAGRPAEVR